jgi:hypothetical protein
LPVVASGTEFLREKVEKAVRGRERVSNEQSLFERGRVFGEFEPVIFFFIPFLSLLLSCKLFYTGFVKGVKGPMAPFTLAFTVRRAAPRAASAIASVR